MSQNKVVRMTSLESALCDLMDRHRPSSQRRTGKVGAAAQGSAAGGMLQASALDQRAIVALLGMEAAGQTAGRAASELCSCLRSLRMCLAETGSVLPGWLPGPPDVVRLYAARHDSRGSQAVLAQGLQQGAA